MIGGEKRRVVLLGYPLGHSLSPLIHNASFRSQGLPFEYTLHETEPQHLGTEIERLKKGGFAGANVTMPHKESIVPLLDACSDVVLAVGAANTLVWRPSESGGVLFGENTDVGGFLAALPDARVLEGPCVILGAGGAARAVAFALLSGTQSRRILVAARRLSQAKDLVENLSPADEHGRLHWSTIDAARDAVKDAALVVNATTVGMHPNVDESPWTTPSDFHPGQLAYDLIYNPSDTRFMREARLAGADTLGGLKMLIEQARLAYMLWTGRELDVQAVETALIS